MADFDQNASPFGAAGQIPQARIVRAAGQAIAPPPEPAREPSAMMAALRSMAEVALGLWPLTAVMVLVIGLFVLVTKFGNP